MTDRQTDGQTDRQTEFSSLDRVCISCSAVKIVVKIVATRCQILSLKCTKFDFGWGSAPDPAGGAYSADPDLLARFKGAYF